jgi:hypothetical protein
MNSAKKSAAETDVISLLTADHNKVRQLFQEFEDIKEDQSQTDLKSELVEQICFELTVHALVEEEIVYPAIRAAIEEDDLMDEAEAEHASVKDLVNQLEQMEPDDEQFDATVMVLSEQVEHHVSEEEGEVFQKVKKAKMDIDQLGQQVRERKDEIEADFNGVPAPQQPRAGKGEHKRAHP